MSVCVSCLFAVLSVMYCVMSYVLLCLCVFVFVFVVVVCFRNSCVMLYGLLVLCVLCVFVRAFEYVCVFCL